MIHKDFYSYHLYRVLFSHLIFWTMQIKRSILVIVGCLALVSSIFLGCKKDTTAAAPKPIIPVVIKDTSIVNRFIYTSLRDYYLWNAQVPSLNNTKYNNKDSLNAYLNSYADPQKFFASLLYQQNTVDKWSFLVNDPNTISNWIQGISETMGYDFMLSYIGTSTNVFGFVRYVFKGSPAEKAGIKRGDLFMKVNDTQLTATNYQSLLFNNITYKLSFASLANNVISLNGKSVTMTAVTMQENPILVDTVLNVGNLKVGYLMYNAFNAGFDIQLNNVFKKFKDAPINKLVLDLRYNGGGSVQSAKYLASMIYGTKTTSPFLKSQYNSGLQAYLTSVNGAASLIENFIANIDSTTTTPVAAINALNLTDVYFITSDNTASASELLINGLKPYMTVFSVGSNTAGKYVASWTLQDWDANGNVNPKDKYAMQPIVVKIANANGISDFINGLSPDYAATEDIANLLPLGDRNETLLKPILNKIQGFPLAAISTKAAAMGLKKLTDSQAQKVFSQQMYMARPNLKK